MIARFRFRKPVDLTGIMAQITSRPTSDQVNTMLAGKASNAAVPHTTSALTNDSGFVTSSGAASAAPVQTVEGRSGNVDVTKEDVNLSNVRDVASYSQTEADARFIRLAKVTVAAAAYTAVQNFEFIKSAYAVTLPNTLVGPIVIKNTAPLLGISVLGSGLVSITIGAGQSKWYVRNSVSEAWQEF